VPVSIRTVLYVNMYKLKSGPVIMAQVIMAQMEKQVKMVHFHY